MRAGDLFRLACRARWAAPRRRRSSSWRPWRRSRRADASAGWCLAVTATSGLVAAYLDEDAAREVYGTAGVAVGGVFAPRGRAVAAAGASRSPAAGRSPAAAVLRLADGRLPDRARRARSRPELAPRALPARRRGDHRHLDGVRPARHGQPRHRRGRTARPGGALGGGDRRRPGWPGRSTRSPSSACSPRHRRRHARGRARGDGRPARAGGRQDARGQPPEAGRALHRQSEVARAEAALRAARGLLVDALERG